MPTFFLNGKFGAAQKWVGKNVAFENNSKNNAVSAVEHRITHKENMIILASRRFFTDPFVGVAWFSIR